MKFPYCLKSNTTNLFPIQIKTKLRYDMCRRRKGGRCTKGTAGKEISTIFFLFYFVHGFESLLILSKNFSSFG